MMFLLSIAAFLLAIGILITVHEYGHYWMARRCNVKVLRFSVGFGRPLLQRRSGPDQTEYALAAIPLGGYVKMADERDESVAAEDLPRAFNRQTVGRRAAIVAAGPAANFLFAIVAFSLMFLVGMQGVRPVIGEVQPASVAAEAGFQPRDEIIEVGGRATPTWEQVALNLIDQGMNGDPIEVRVRTESGQEFWRTLNIRDSRLLLGDGPLLGKLGISALQPWSEPVLGELLPEGAAARAGLMPGDRIRAVDGQAISSWTHWVDSVRERPNTEIQLQIERQGQVFEMRLRTDERIDNGQRIGMIGAFPYVDEAAVAALQTTVRYGMFESVSRGMQRTWDMSVLTLRVMWRLLTGEAALSNLAGPVGIAEYAGVSASVGLAAFLGFLGLVSISLGIINLLPIPMLDGGHLLYYLVEVIKGSPVSEAFEAIGQRVGIVMIGLLMTLALYNDFTRIFG